MCAVDWLMNSSSPQTETVVKRVRFLQGGWSRMCSPDQRGEGQQHAERQRHEANASRSGRRTTGHQLQELLSLFISGSAGKPVISDGGPLVYAQYGKEPVSELLVNNRLDLFFFFFIFQSKESRNDFEKLWQQHTKFSWVKLTYHTHFLFVKSIVKFSSTKRYFFSWRNLKENDLIALS